MTSLIITLCLLGLLQIRGEAAEMNTGRETQKATFAGGCFWCMEPPFEKLEGVKEVVSGYTGGTVEDPSYEEVSAGDTGHAEAVEVRYDPTRISYEKLLDVFWKNINPTTPGRQFADVGSQYRSAVFYHNEEQKRVAEQSKRRLEESGRFDNPVVTEIAPAGAFYQAEDYHQDYYRKHPAKYKTYRMFSGRDQYLKTKWTDD